MSLISQNAVLKPLRKKNLDNELSGGSLDGISDKDNKSTEELEMANSNKKKRRRQDDDTLRGKKLEALKDEKEMKRLEGSLFGNLYNPIKFGEEGNEMKENDKEEEEKVGRDAPLFIMDKTPGTEMVVYKEALPSQDGEEVVEKRKPAWIDDEEESTKVDIINVNRLRKLRKEANERVISGTEYVARLRAQHVKLNPGTDWARVDRKSDGSCTLDDESEEESGLTLSHGYEDADDILRSNDELVVRGSVKLLPGLLEYSRLVNANAEEPSNGPINSVQFHRNGQLLLTAGLDRRLRFFQIDGKRNPKIQSIFIEDCPIHKASFLPNGSEVIISGRRKFFYSFDLMKAAANKIGPLTGREERSLEYFEVSPDSSTIAFVGNEGYILLVSSQTKELIGTLKMNGSVRSLAFTDGGLQLMSGGGDGHVYHWDLRTMRCIHKGDDEGSLTTSSLCASPNSNFFAAGSSSGIVNVYKKEEFLGGKRKPWKTIENLTTTVDRMKFNPDAQILAICSSSKKNGLKLVHVPTFNVFSNYPPPRFSFQYPRCLDFSPGGGLMTIGNAAGKVLLYKLHYYKNA